MSIKSVMPSNHLILSPPSSLALLSFPASGFFPMTRHFASGGQSIGASASVLSMNIQSWFPLGLTGLISLQTKGLSVFSSTTIWKHQSFGAQPSLWSSSHICTWLLEKPQLWLDGPLSAKWCHCFLKQYLGFLPRSKRLLISWLQSSSVVILEPKKINLPLFPFFSPIYLPSSDGTGCHDLNFLNVEFYASFFTLLFHPHQEAL